jgi:hypothetical protein
VQVRLKKECEGGDVQDRIGTYIMDAEIIKDQKLTKEPRAGRGETTLHVAHKEYPLILTWGRLHFVPNGAPDLVLFLREKAGAGEALELLGGDRGAVPVGGDVVGRRGLGGARLGVSGFRRHWSKAGARGGIREKRAREEGDEAEANGGK